MNIDELIENQKTISISDFFKRWEAQKDVFIIKYDGLRDMNKFTVLLLGYKSRFEPINIECDDVQCGIEEVLLKYKEILKKLETNA